MIRYEIIYADERRIIQKRRPIMRKNRKSLVVLLQAQIVLITEMMQLLWKNLMKVLENINDSRI